MEKAHHRARGTVGAMLGRHDELAALEQAFVSGTRLVVVTGMGGIGKSTLARAFAERARGSGEHVLSVWLESARSMDDAADDLGAALDIPLEGSLAVRVSRMAIALNKLRRPLIVFDAFETVLESAYPLVHRLMALVPDVRVLVTSREWARKGGEAEVRIGPLAVSGDDSPAVRLFHQRAPLQLDDAPESRRAIRRIVEAVDGIPLAIEFAAARAAVLPVGVLADRVGSSLALLADPSRGRSPRQVAMERTLSWSWALLPETAQRALMYASVFRGAFNILDIDGVLGPDTASLIDAFQHLTQTSMVHLVDARGVRGPEYRLLGPVREFAAGRLEASREDEDARRRHRAWFLDGVEPDDEVWLRAVDGLLDLLDARTAEFDVICQTGDTPLARLRAEIRRLVARDRRSVPTRNVERLERAIERTLEGGARAPSHRRAVCVAFLLLSEFAFKTGEPDRMRAYLAAARQWTGDEDILLSRLHMQQAAAHNLDGDLAGALAASERAYACAVSSGEPCCWSLAAGRLASTLGPGSPRTAGLKREVLDQAGRSGSSLIVWLATAQLADLLISSGDSAERIALMERGYEAARRSGMRYAIVVETLRRGLYLYRTGRGAQAIETFRRVVEETENAFNPNSSGHARLFLGIVSHHVQDYDEAARCYAASSQLLEGTHSGDVARWLVALLARETGQAHTLPSSVPPGPEGQIIGAWRDAVVRGVGFEPSVDVLDNPLPESLLSLARAVCARRTPPDDALLVSPDGLRVPGHPWISTSRRRVLRALIDALVDARIVRTGQPLGQAEIVSRVWPEEARPMSSSSRNRMHVLFNSLRKLGLDPFLETLDDGWRLSPDLHVIRCDSPPEP